MNRYYRNKNGIGHMPCFYQNNGKIFFHDAMGDTLHFDDKFKFEFKPRKGGYYYIGMYDMNLTTNSNTEIKNSKFDVDIYPNPTNNIINIESNQEIKSIFISNIQGQQLIATKSKTIDLSQYPAGMYVVQIVNSKGERFTKKVIKRE